MSASHGVLAEYATPQAYVEALRRARREGYERIEGYSPYAVPEAEEEWPGRPSPLPAVMAAAALAGGAGGFALQVWAAYDFPIDVGGRPLFSWPAFVPITFELSVLTASLAGVAAFCLLARFPRLHHPVFADPRFVRASQDRFFLCIRADDPRYSPERAAACLAAAGAESVREVAA